MSENTKKINKAIKIVAELSLDKSSQVLSKMLRCAARIMLKSMEMTDISTATARVNQQSNEVIGAVIDLVGDVKFKFLFYVDRKDAFLLNDLFLRRPQGTTKVFDEYVMGTVQEIANIISSAITNVFAADFRIKISPTPPVVINEFAGTLFQEIMMTLSPEVNEIPLMRALFFVEAHQTLCSMYILPETGVLERLEASLSS